MRVRPMGVMGLLAAVTVALTGCGHAGATTAAGPTTSGPTKGPGSATTRPAAGTGALGSVSPSPSAKAASLKAGNPNGHATVPAAAQAVDTSHPTHVIGKGTPAGCTSAAVVQAVAEGGVITFDCGPAPVTITMAATAKVRNTSSRVVIDGGGLVTLDGAGKRRILYQDTCDQAQVWATAHCQDQETPQLTVQNITFANGNSTGQLEEGGGGGAILDRGGRLKVVNSVFLHNRCDPTGPDLGGAAVRALSQSHNLPAYVVHSTFQYGICSNGAALSSIGVSWTVLNSLFSHNAAIGKGANPARSGTPGGGSGGAIYNDGNTYTLSIAGSVIEDNHATEGGGAVFYVSNDRTGTMSIHSSTLLRNPSDGFETAGLKGIFFLGAHNPDVSGSTLR